MSGNATDSITADDNVIPLRPGASDTAQPEPPPRQQKRRAKPLTNAQALAWLCGKDGIEVDSYAALGAAWGWERSRTSKAVKAWREAGKITVEQGGKGGKITIRIAAPGPSMLGESPGRRSGKVRGKSPWGRSVKFPLRRTVKVTVKSGVKSTVKRSVKSCVKVTGNLRSQFRPRRRPPSRTSASSA